MFGGVNKVLTLSKKGLLLYNLQNCRIDFADFGVFRTPGGFKGDVTTGQEMPLRTLTLFVGHIPVLQKADWIFFSVNALSYALLNIGQKKALVIETRPPPLFINSSNSRA